MIVKLIFPNSSFTHAELVSMYPNGDIVFNMVCLDAENNITKRECQNVAVCGDYPFKLTDEIYFNLKEGKGT